MPSLQAEVVIATSIAASEVTFVASHSVSRLMLSSSEKHRPQLPSPLPILTSPSRRHRRSSPHHRVMYILCNEEPLWMNLCLKGASDLLQYRGSWKKTTLLHYYMYPAIPSVIITYENVKHYVMCGQLRKDTAKELEINEATNDFDPSWKSGEGRYGSVYKAVLPNMHVRCNFLPARFLPAEFSAGNIENGKNHKKSVGVLNFHLFCPNSSKRRSSSNGRARRGLQRGRIPAIEAWNGGGRPARPLRRSSQ
ncbi:hypothetical protein PIB30_075162 [Stylosanthes scabra]|uniref:Uncharacterized protein n=1 Tax=Stylosanthes scabra TaxID=79078 RepID=A0ABU6UP94_9FABA|nr:hypothetical protein [Stylosanthes scabra]